VTVRKPSEFVLNHPEILIVDQIGLWTLGSLNVNGDSASETLKPDAVNDRGQ